MSSSVFRALFSCRRVENSRRGAPRLCALVVALLLGAFAPAGRAAEPPPAEWPRHTLRADAWWLLNLPGGRRVDASALMRLPDGAFVVLNDQDAGAYRVRVPDGAVGGNTNGVDLVRVPGLLPPDEAMQITRGSGLRLDLEGLAQDERGRWYLSEEGRRLVLRWDPATQVTERLDIDWAPARSFFHVTDVNASFEGVAVGGGRLYVANERQTGRIIVVDLATLKVTDHFTVMPAGAVSPDTHFSDLCWAEGSLWALLRDVRKMVRINPVSKRIEAEFDYGEMELAPESGYGLLFAPGFMEGLWVEADAFWLLVDNNGVGRRARGSDTRPTLFRCPRPDRVRVPGAAAP